MDWHDATETRTLRPAGPSPEERELFDACREGDVARVEELVGAGISPNVRNKKGVTPLIVSCRHGRVDAAKALVRLGAEIDDLTPRGFTALMVASRMGQVAAVQTLLGAGAAPNILTTGRSTAVLLAAEAGHADVVEILCHSGADRAAKDDEGRSVDDYLSQNGVRPGQPLLTCPSCGRRGSPDFPWCRYCGQRNWHAVLKDWALVVACCIVGFPISVLVPLPFGYLGWLICLLGAWRLPRATRALARRTSRVADVGEWEKRKGVR
jgi:hypothetical protein